MLECRECWNAGNTRTAGIRDAGHAGIQGMVNTGNVGNTGNVANPGYQEFWVQEMQVAQGMLDAGNAGISDAEMGECREF